MIDAPKDLVIQEGMLDGSRTWSCRFSFGAARSLNSTVTVLERSSTEYFKNEYFLSIQEAESLGDLNDPFVVEFRSRVVGVAHETGLVHSVQEDSKQTWFCRTKPNFDPASLIEAVVGGLFSGEFGTRLAEWIVERDGLPRTPVAQILPDRNPNDAERLSLVEITLNSIATDSELGTDRMFDTLRALRGLSRRGLNEDREIMAAVQAGEQRVIRTEMLPSEADRYRIVLNELGASVETRVLGPVIRNDYEP